MGNRRDSGSRHLRRLLELKFSGGNFEAGSLPASNAIEVTTFERLLVAFAKRRFRHENPSRKKVPKNFDSQFRLTLAKIKDGSTVLPLRPMEISERPSLVDGFDLAAATQDLFAALEEILRGEVVPDLDSETASQLRRLGATLKDDETLILAPRTKRPITYGMDERRAVAETLTRGGAQVESILIGSVKMLDVSGRFEISLLDNSTVEGNAVQPASWDELHKLLAQSAARWLWLECTWMHYFGAPNRVARIVDVNQVGSLRPMSGAHLDRLAQLAALPDGWLDGEGIRLSVATMRRAAAAIAALDDRGAPSPSMFLGEDGEVRLEWLDSARHAVLSIDPDGQYGVFITTTGGTGDTYAEGIGSFEDAANLLGMIDGADRD